jgi:hypothetical protein
MVKRFRVKEGWITTFVCIPEWPLNPKVKHGLSLALDKFPDDANGFWSCDSDAGQENTTRVIAMHETIKIEGSVHGGRSLKASPMKEQEERRKNEHKYDKSFKFVSKNSMPKSPCRSRSERHGLLGIPFLDQANCCSSQTQRTPACMISSRTICDCATREDNYE